MSGDAPPQVPHVSGHQYLLTLLDWYTNDAAQYWLFQEAQSTLGWSAQADASAGVRNEATCE